MMKFLLGGLALAMLSAGPAMSADVIVMPQAGQSQAVRSAGLAGMLARLLEQRGRGRTNYIGTLQPYRV